MNKINNKEAWLTPNEIKAIQNEIQDALLKRRFFAPIKVLIEDVKKAKN